jgi:hypothetical protein
MIVVAAFEAPAVDKGGHFAAWEEPELFSASSERRSGRSANRSEDFGARVMRADSHASAATSIGIRKGIHR